MLSGSGLALALAVAVAAQVRAAHAAQEPAARPVLAIHWSSENFPSTAAVDQRAREVLLACPGAPVDYYAEYLESDLFAPEEAALALRDYIKRKYADRMPAVVIANADPAKDFALDHRAELFPDAPILFLGVQRPTEAVRTGGPGVSGVVSTGRFRETLALALKLHPETQRVFVVANAPILSLPDTIRPELEAVAGSVALQFIDAPTVSELVTAIEAVPRGSLILYVRYSQERPGQVLYPNEVASLVAAAAAVPVYTSAEAAVGDGAVGGVVYHARELATRLGEMACAVLNGTPAAAMPIEQSRGIPTFDWRQLQRWGISPADLPANAVIRFRPDTPWSLYPEYIAAALLALVAQGVMIAALVVHRQRRRKSEAHNTAILRALPDMMFLQTTDGVFVDFHAPDPGMLLRDPKQFVGRPMRDVLPPEAFAVLDRAFQRVVRAKEAAVVEYSLTMRDGLHHYEARLVPCATNEVLSVVRDITARKRAEAALSASEERYALATAAGGVGVWDWNLETNEVYMDPSLKALLGFGDGDIRNHFDDWHRLIHPDDWSLFSERTRAHIEGRSLLFEVEHRKVHSDGSIRWFISRGSAVRRDGVAIRIIGTDTDVTERKQSELTLQDTQAELTRVSRLTALGEFAASIAHEVSQPLTAIMMNAKTCLRWLGSATPDLSEVRAAVWDVIEASRRADDVIRRNRELFKHHEVQKAPVDVNSVIRETAQLASAHLCRSHVMLVTLLGEDLPTIVADRVELQQVLLNLIGNAIDAMENVSPAQRRIEIESSPGDGSVQVSVRDNGIGLDNVDMTRIFKPSYTTKQHGTGVGLSISRSIVEAHGGRLWAESNNGHGATFSFTVPVEATL